MKVWILTSKFGHGHLSAAKALAEELCEQGHDTIVDDIVELAYPKQHKIIYGVFNHLICRLSPVYNFINQLGRNPKLTPLKNLNLQVALKDISPDIIITTWSACARMLGNISIPVYVCITDVGVHSGWIHNNAHGYFVADSHVKQRLIAMGVEPIKIQVHGIPVKNIFRTSGPKISSSKKHILVMGGGLGILPWIIPMLDRLVSCTETKITVITGRNKKLYQRLTEKYPTITTIGYTQDVPRYLSEADILVSRPGGVSIFESIFMLTPIIAVSPQYAQEYENAQFIRRNGIGDVIFQSDSAGERIAQLLTDERMLTELRQNLLKFKEKLNDARAKADWQIYGNSF